MDIIIIPPTGIYTNVSNKSIYNIKNPLDNLDTREDRKMRINISDIFETGEILETVICDIPLSDKIFIIKIKQKYQSQLLISAICRTLKK